MARFARVVAVDARRHITQRGNARQVVFEGDADRLVYLRLLRQHCRLGRLKLLGYCLMSNHVHLIATPARAESMLLALKHTHERYAGHLGRPSWTRIARSTACMSSSDSVATLDLSRCLLTVAIWSAIAFRGSPFRSIAASHG